MEFVNFREIRLPKLGLGTWGMGGGTFRSSENDRQDIDAVKFALELGITHIDTAEIYAQGHAEELVAQAIKGYDRNELFITSKVHPSHLGYWDVIKACQQSLERLQLTHLDLYLVHWPNPDIPLEETMAAMDYLVEKNMTKFIGVSNFSVNLMMMAQEFCQNALFTNQVAYSLAEKEPEDTLLPYCQEQNMLLTAYSPLGRGVIKPGWNGLLDELAQKYQKTPGQVALNYLLSKENVIAIPKSSNSEHLKENLGCFGWVLKKEDLKRIKENF